MHAQSAPTKFLELKAKDMLTNVLKKPLEVRLQRFQLEQRKNRVLHGKYSIVLNSSNSYSYSSSPVDSSKNFSHTIPCRTKHQYCLKCLQNSMNEFIESNTAPVCHSALCPYELSRYDVACLPVQPDMITRLLPLVKSTQRPQCPLCFFYIDFKTMDDFQRHALSCNSQDMIPCNYCHCLFNKHRLNDHSQQCQNDSPAQQRQALINFLLPRTKYALTPPQIHVFLEVRRKSRLPLDARSIVDALAELGKLSSNPFL